MIPTVVALFRTGWATDADEDATFAMLIAQDWRGSTSSAVATT